MANYVPSFFFSFLAGEMFFSTPTIFCVLPFRPNLSQFQSLEIRRSTFPNYIKILDRRILRLNKMVLGFVGLDRKIIKNLPAKSTALQNFFILS